MFPLSPVSLPARSSRGEREKTPSAFFMPNTIGGRLVHAQERRDIAQVDGSGRVAEPAENQSRERNAIASAFLDVPDVTALAEPVRGSDFKIARATPVAVARAQQDAFQVIG